jgi:SAM-dependent methyltransferase
VDDQERWQLRGSAPELYQRYLVPAVTAPWAADLAERAGLHSGARVLDVATGTGVVARAAAARVGPRGRVAGLDVNTGMLAVARSVPSSGPAIRWLAASALSLPFRDATFDAVVCQLGLQFFPDRPAALREARRVVAASGRLALSVFGPIEHNPATHALSDALDRRVRPGASAAKRAEHALADTAMLDDLLTAAGFGRVDIQTVRKLVRFPSPGEYVRVQLAATPLASVLDGDPPGRREELVGLLVGDVGAALAQYTGEGGLSFPQEVHVAVASG